MNNNQSNERALLAGCKGVFASASYINVGTAECVCATVCASRGRRPGRTCHRTGEGPRGSVAA